MQTAYIKLGWMLGFLCFTLLIQLSNSGVSDGVDMRFVSRRSVFYRTKFGAYRYLFIILCSGPMHVLLATHLSAPHGM